ASRIVKRLGDSLVIDPGGLHHHSELRELASSLLHPLLQSCNPPSVVANFSFVRALALTGLYCHSQGILRYVNTKPTHRSSPNANSRETQSGQLARLVHADCRPNVTASWNTVQLLGVPQAGKGQADLLRRLKVFGRKQSLPSSGVPVRAAGTRSRYKVGIYPDSFTRARSEFIPPHSAPPGRNKFRPTGR